MPIIQIPYQPRNWAQPLHETDKKKVVMVLHRRAGKTTATLNHLQRDCLQIPKSQFAYIGPTYTQTKLIAWKIVREISQNIPGVKYNATAPFQVNYPNGSTLYLLGAESPDALRGIKLWGVGFDEYELQPPTIYSEVVSKALADTNGYVIFFGTPKGKNEFYRIFENAKNHPEEWLTIFKTIDDSLRDEEGQTIRNLKLALEADRRSVQQGIMTQEEFEQEWYCSFETAIKGAYYARQLAAMREDGRIKLVPYDPAVPVHTVSDLGVGQKFATGFFQKAGSELHLIDFWEGTEHDGLPQFALMLQNKGYVYGKHFVPQDAKATEIGSGKTRVQLAKEIGLTLTVLERNPGVEAGIEKARLTFARLWVDEEHCQVWLDYMAQYRQAYDHKKKIFLPKPYHDFTSHAADMFRVAALVEEEMTSEEGKVYKQKDPEPISIYQG